ncbi:Pimeloyl-ACP methyl ester carboxylesterase [Tangfeifania diversioriginum]|uniref:Pimeloyl-ACP methyl ester carboxylesterase n=1 Tax=Tangfeifania diversioriginum TaxID=1168035 RepID=A0A1M6C4K0_9BACT|nr:alpha/beta hydrolase [Tangfeifania diversioriginum]SHI55950.1 Pimeloyl-ACP methyl ester carboxylesterase [Tangfeifania diversioriginum]
MLYHKIFRHKTSKTWVVFVHGAGGSNVVWFRQLRDFKKQFNVLLVDLRGHGKSKKQYSKEEIYKFDEIAADVIYTMDHLNIEKAHFVGISLGCIVIRAMDKLAPGRAESIILGGAVVQFNKKINGLVSVAKLLNSILPYMWLYRLNAWILIPSRKHTASRNLFISEAVRLGDREFKKWLRMSGEIRDNLKEFLVKEASAPVLYLMGERDHMFLPMVSNLVKKHLNSKLEVIRNSGHVCNLDQPEVFNERSIQFIKKVSG